MNTAPITPGIAVVLATGNRDKVRELQPMLEELSPLLKLHSLTDLGLSPEIDETEPTLEGNARLKATGIFSLVEPRFEWLIVLADDTGLEVDALDGEPGVRSARFAPVPAGSSPSYEQNVTHLLESMHGAACRSARFRTVIALKGRLPLPDGGIMSIDETVEGRIEGSITTERHGSGGFGYDPVFRPEGSDRTFAEMSLEEKNAISHRARAVRGAASRIGDIMAQTTITPTETGNLP
jgi:XTP/dITP diphosphohydrolase